MPQDVIATVHHEDRVELDFLTEDARIEGLRALKAANGGSARHIRTNSGGTKRTYEVSEEEARAAGLLDREPDTEPEPESAGEPEIEDAVDPEDDLMTEPQEPEYAAEEPEPEPEAAPVPVPPAPGLPKAETPAQARARKAREAKAARARAAQ